MEFQDYFPVWKKLTSVQQQQLKGSAISRTVKKGTVEITDAAALEELQNA